jgi:hypothetical protein
MATVDKAQHDNRVLRQSAAPESAPARSPFTPIANYGFLSNCCSGHLDGELDGNIPGQFEWSPAPFA